MKCSQIDFHVGCINLRLHYDCIYVNYLYIYYIYKVGVKCLNYNVMYINIVNTGES